MSKFSFQKRLALALTLGVAAGASGCGKGRAEGERVPVVPVTGKITFNGQPIPGALVVLHPQGAGADKLPRAQATVAADGSFQLTSYEGNDGAAPGDYKVTVQWWKLEGKGNDVKAGPNVLPKKYEKPSTTDLSIKVAQGPTQLEPIKLKR